MEDSAHDSVIPHATTEMKRVIPDVIAVVEQGPQSIAGSNPALAANVDKRTPFSDKVSMDEVKAQCEARIAEMRSRILVRKFRIQAKRLELQEKHLEQKEKVFDESIKVLDSLPKLIPYYAWVKSIGRDLSWGYKYRKKGWIKTIVLGGSVFITEDAIEEFKNTSDKNKK